MPNICVLRDAELRAAMNVVGNEAFVEEIKEVKKRILGPKPTKSKQPKSAPLK
jgi:hypothetical protein